MKLEIVEEEGVPGPGNAQQRVYQLHLAWRDLHVPGRPDRPGLEPRLKRIMLQCLQDQYAARVQRIRPSRVQPGGPVEGHLRRVELDSEPYERLPPMVISGGGVAVCAR